MGYNASNNN